MIPFQFELELAFGQLRLLQAYHIGLRAFYKFLEAFIHTGSQTVYIP
jgi:hypothetical protein